MMKKKLFLTMAAILLLCVGVITVYAVGQPADAEPAQAADKQAAGAIVDEQAARGSFGRFKCAGFYTALHGKSERAAESGAGRDQQEGLGNLSTQGLADYRAAAGGSAEADRGKGDRAWQAP